MAVVVSAVIHFPLRQSFAFRKPQIWGFEMAPGLQERLEFNLFFTFVSAVIAVILLPGNRHEVGRKRDKHRQENSRGSGL